MEGRKRVRDDEIAVVNDKCYILILPRDILALLLGAYCVRNAFKIALTCKAFNEIVNDQPFLTHGLRAYLAQLIATQKYPLFQTQQLLKHCGRIAQHDYVKFLFQDSEKRLIRIGQPKNYDHEVNVYLWKADEHTMMALSASHRRTILTKGYTNNMGLIDWNENRLMKYYYVDHPSRCTMYIINDEIIYMEYYRCNTNQTFYGKGKYNSKGNPIPDEKHGAWK